MVSAAYTAPLKISALRFFSDFAIEKLLLALSKSSFP